MVLCLNVAIVARNGSSATLHDPSYLIFVISWKAFFPYIYPISSVKCICRNLQAAVGCYLDYYSGTRLPSMQIMSDVTIGEGESITPDTEYVNISGISHRDCRARCELNISFEFRFVQSWSVKNNGDEVWPYGCYIKCTSNESLPTTAVSPVEPGHCTVVSVKLRSPAEFGSFQTKWRLFTSNGSCYGGKFCIRSQDLGIHSHVTFSHCSSPNRYDVVDSSSYRNWYFSINATIV